MGQIRHSVRMAFLGVGALLIVAAGCGFSDVLEWAGEPSASNATSTPNGGTGTAQPQVTPIPTAPMWVYATPTATIPTSATATPTSDYLSDVTRTPSTSATPTPAATSTPTPRPTATPSPTATPVPLVSLLPFLPTEADLPGRMRLENEVEFLTVEQIASEAGNAAEYQRLLGEWGYTRGASREFLLPNPGVFEFLSELLGFEARVMEFDSANDATAAIEFQRDFALERPDWRLRETTVERIGDASMALTGTADYDGMEVRVSAIFVRDGDLVYRFVAVSGAYDAFSDAVRIARTVVERNN